MASNIQEYILSLKDRFSGNLSKASAEMQRFNKLIAAGTSLIAGYQAMQLFNKSISEGREEQAFGKAYETLLKSKEATTVIMKQMDSLNKNSIISESGLKEAGKTLLGVGVDASKLTNILSRLGDVSMGNEGKFTIIVDVYAKAMQKGFVESRMITEIPGALEVFSQMTGKSGVELRKFMAEGTIGIKELDEVIRRMTDNGGRYFGAMADQLETDSGQAIIAKKNVNDLFELIGLKLLPAHQQWLNMQNAFVAKATVFVEWVDRNSESLKAAAKAALVFGAAIAAYTYIPAFIGGLMAAYRAVTTLSIGMKMGAITISTFNTTLALSPIGIAIAGIAALAAGFYLFTKSATAAKEAQSQFNKSIQDAKNKQVSEVAKLNTLLGIYRDTTRSTIDRKKALDQLNGSLQDQGMHLTAAQAKTQSAIGVLNDYGAAAARAALDVKFADQNAESAVAFAELQQKFQTRIDALTNLERPQEQKDMLAEGIRAKFNNQWSDLNKSNAERTAIQKAAYKAIGGGGTSSTNGGGGGSFGGGSGTDTASGIAGGGVRNLTINLTKFFDQIVFNGTTIDKDANTAAGTVVKEFLRVLNSANKVQAGTN